MTQEERKNLIYKFKCKIEKVIQKERRENVITPTGDEYIELWEIAVAQAAQLIQNPRPVGRPKGTTTNA